ncbi:MAG TPA: hypothetical protein VND21_00485, partial [Planctomycetota bacterium]|nr:hypothetical protein [Planctomycetota bacterium]
WGMQSYEVGDRANKAAAQLTTFVPPDWKFGASRPAIVVEIAPKDATERIVLAALAPKETLEATWGAVDRILRTWKKDSVDAGSRFLVPTIRLDEQARFSALEGSALSGVKDSKLLRFEERVRFRLSETGASLAAEAVIVASLGIHPDLVFDRPFLVALRRVGAPHPYFLLWVGNDALLERYEPLRGAPLDAATLDRLRGTWVTDAKASAVASALRALELGLESLDSFGFAPGAKPTPEEVRQRIEAKFAAEVSKDGGLAPELTLAVADGGRASASIAPPSLAEHAQPPLVLEGRFERSATGVSLRLLDPSEPSEDGAARPSELPPTPVRLEGDTLRVELDLAGCIFVLRRK